MTTRDWIGEIDKRHESLLALRRDFHRHPELSFQERRTSAIIAERLTTAGLDVRTGVASTGVVGLLRGDRPGRTIAWRADIDALPLTETAELPFASATPGVMHACGHDGHTAIAITLAEIMAARRADVPGTAVFIFQPAEEVLGGAKPMIEAGVLDDPRVEQIYGLHLTTEMAAGIVQVRSGPSMASGDGWSIEIRGAGGHGAYPHLSVDPIIPAAHIVLGLQHLIARETPAHESAVLTVGQIQSGTKSNIIPDRAIMRGTLRTFERELRDRLVARMGTLAADIARGFQAEAHLSFDMGCPAVVNHVAESDLVRRCAAQAVGADAVVEGRRVMPSDDMSLFLRERPGCYFRVGISPGDGRPHPHHAPDFVMNESGLGAGLSVALAVMLSALAG